MHNPYLEVVLKLGPLNEIASRYATRQTLVKSYSWAIPNENAINTIKKFSPIIEIGAGNGYWAWLLREEGVDIVALDHLPPDRAPNFFFNYKDIKTEWKPRATWTPVGDGGPRSILQYPGRTLLLCWPPYQTKMAASCLAHYRGEYIIYVGEGQGGCTGSKQFHRELEHHWKQIEIIDIPQWPNIYDSLFIWQRLPPL